MEVKKCMTPNVCCCNTNSTISETAKLMNDNHCGCIPVCNSDNCVVGILTDRDIVLRGIASGKDVNTTKVSEVMSINVCSCHPTTDIEEATNLMQVHQIRRIPVIENNKVVGILTLGDLVTSKNVNNTEVEKVVNNVCNCECNHKNAE